MWQKSSIALNVFGVFSAHQGNRNKTGKIIEQLISYLFFISQRGEFSTIIYPVNRYFIRLAYILL